MPRRHPFLAVLLLTFLSATHAAEKAPRPTAPWPPPPGRLRVIIDADADNEVDDQYALALALGNPDRLKIEGLIAAHFGDAGGHKGIDRSIAEIHRVLDNANIPRDKYPIKRGADPLTYADKPPAGDGVDFIIQTAKSATPEDPIWLVLLGPATDAAAALLKDPKIADRLIVFWHGRSAWPNECLNFNAQNDPKAARLLFSLQCRLVLFDTGTHITIDPRDFEQHFVPIGPLGKYLNDIRRRKPQWANPNKGIFDLGDIAALVDPACVKFERVEAPAVTAAMRYDFTKKLGPIIRIHEVDKTACFAGLESALKRLASSHHPKAP